MHIAISMALGLILFGSSHAQQVLSVDLANGPAIVIIPPNLGPDHAAQSIADQTEMVNRNHTLSAKVKEIREMIQREYNVKCKKGRSHTFVPGLFRRVRYNTICENDTTRLRLQIRSKYIDDETQSQFEFISYRVRAI